MPQSSQTKPDTPLQAQPTLSPNISIQPVTTSALSAYRRLINLLLPIRYPDKFYKDSIANPTSSSLALCAAWHDLPHSSKRKYESVDDAISSARAPAEPKIIAGIQCRLEPLPTPPSSTTSTCQQQTLYIQTLAVLSPYRSLGIATVFLDTMISTAIIHYCNATSNVTEIHAHVWEANEDALEWYRKRGFVVEEGVVEGYYRKLRPSGARVMRRRVGVGDWLKVTGEVKMREGGELSNGFNGDGWAVNEKDEMAND